MAETAPNIHAAIGHGPTMLPVTHLPAGIHPGFVVGESDRIHDSRVVAYAIISRADYKVGDRDFSGTALGLHEVVLMRHLYEQDGGSVNLNASWPPGMNRLVPLTQEQLMRELDRFRTTFIVPKNNSVLEITPLFLGVEPAEQLKRLHAVMRRQVEAWGKLIETAKARIPAEERAGRHPEILQSMAYDHITPRELEAIANMADPSRDGVEDLVLPEVLIEPTPKTHVPGKVAMTPEEAQKAAELDVDLTEDPTLVLMGRLKSEASLTEAQSLEVASLVESVGQGGSVSDDDIIAKIGSKAKLAGVRRVLKG